MTPFISNAIFSAYISRIPRTFGIPTRLTSEQCCALTTRRDVILKLKNCIPLPIPEFGVSQGIIKIKQGKKVLSLCYSVLHPKPPGCCNKVLHVISNGGYKAILYIIRGVLETIGLGVVCFLIDIIVMICEHLSTLLSYSIFFFRKRISNS